MTSKHMRERDENERGRSRKRSRNENSGNSEKREALRRMFGRVRVGMENHPNVPPDDLFGEPSLGYESEVYGDENEDPLLDSVPVNLCPQQLGFLLCAQETLRFLHGNGMTMADPTFSRLRSRLLRGIDEMAVA